jgi:periplasmic protein TonB
MDSKKVIFWPVIISIIGHVALISVSGMIDLRDNVKAAEIFTVDIKDTQPEPQPVQKEEKKEVKQPAETKKVKQPGNNGWREDTVDLNSSDIRYSAYLVKIKRKLLQIWQYPQKAYDQNEEGVVAVRISIDANGRLAGTNLLSSSGSKLLDESTLGVVQRAAPFEQLPGSYNLERLHVVASFSYKIVE